jgi:hypothetical protein
MGRRFLGCRAGGQTHNAGRVDLNSLSAFFLEQCAHDPRAIERAIETNSQAGGWLVFATHDVTEKPSRFGVTPDFFRQAVATAARSGARVLPAAEALALLVSEGKQR